MDKDYLIQLTQDLYRLTLLFPKKEPLRYKMREIADDILAKLIQGQPLANFTEARPLQNLQGLALYKKSLEGMINDLETLDCFFEVAKNQNWVAGDELSRVQEEYNRTREQILARLAEVMSRQFADLKQRQVVAQNNISDNEEASANLTAAMPQQMVLQALNFRQEKILEILRDKEKVQVWQVKQIFPETSKRTLRRDFGFLLKQGVIERIGERNETFYQLKD